TVLVAGLRAADRDRQAFVRGRNANDDLAARVGAQALVALGLAIGLVAEEGLHPHARTGESLRAAAMHGRSHEDRLDRRYFVTRGCVFRRDFERSTRSRGSFRRDWCRSRDRARLSWRRR